MRKIGLIAVCLIFPPRMKAKGNMAEYLLPAVLVGLVAVGALAWTVNSTPAQNGITGLFQGESTQVEQGKRLLSTRSFGQSPLLQTFEYTTESGQMIRIPNFPTDLSAAVEVDGTQGTTEKLLAAYEQWIDALVKAGEITQDQGNLMKTLSTHGHHMANQQGVLEKGIASCGESKRCVWDMLNNLDQNEQVAQNGGLSFRDAYFQNSPTPANSIEHMKMNGSLPDKNQTRDLPPHQRQLFSQFGILKAEVDNDPLYNNNFDNMRVGQSLHTFLSTYERVLSQVPLSPHNQRLMNYFSGSIVNLSMSAVSVANGVFDEKQSRLPSEFNQAVAFGMKRNEEKNRSELMHVHAGGICHLADGKDSRQGCE